MHDTDTEKAHRGPRWESVLVRDLKVGDVVWAHGMRLEITDAPQMSRSHRDEHGGVWWTDALVTNVADLEDQWLVNMTAEHEPWPNRHVRTGVHRWGLQGNDLAHTCARDLWEGN